LAVVAAVCEGVLHFVNAATLESTRLDLNEEYTLFTLANSWAILACATAATLAALLGLRHRRKLIALAVCLTFFSADESLVLHERVTAELLATLGLGDVYDSVVWPVLYLPLLLTVAVLLLLVGESAPTRGRQCVRAGLALLAFAVFLEIVSAPWSTGRSVVHTVEGGFEEMAELAGWILIATGLASLVVLPERRFRITRVSRS
jgi:hypothetical protein